MSKTYSILYSSAALEDLRAIYRYLAFEVKAPRRAENQINRIRKSIRSLDSMPMRYTLVDWEPWQSAGMHKLPVDHYVVYYAIDADSQTVAIIRIFYSGRDVKSIITADED